MSARIAVRAAPGFAGGGLRDFNRLAWACARAGGADRVTLRLEGPGPAEPTLRLQNLHGDPVALPGPLRGIFHDERARAAFAAAALDALPPHPESAEIMNDFLPPAGATQPEAAAALLARLLPGLRVELAPDSATGASERASAHPAAPEEPPRILWLSARARRACAEIGADPEQLAAAPAEAGERYRPQLRGELAEALARGDELWDAELERLRGIALEVDPGLLGAWSRLDRGVRKSLGDFRGAAERCLDNHAGIRRSRWHRLYQDLRPAGGWQDEGYSLLHLVLAHGLPFPLGAEFLGRMAKATMPEPGKTADSLILDL